MRLPYGTGGGGSGEPVTEAAGATDATRHHLVADADLWRRNRIWLLYPALLLVGFAVLGLAARHTLDPSLLVLAAILAFAGGAVYWRKATRYVSMGPESLLLRAGRRRGAIGFDQLRLTRTQTLGSVYDAPSRRAQLPATLRRYAERPVVVVRVDEGGAGLADAARVLGRRVVLDRDLILLVEGAAALEAQLAPAIPRRPPAPSARAGRSARPSRRRAS